MGFILRVLSLFVCTSQAAVPFFSAPTQCGARSQLQILTVDPSWLSPDAVFDASIDGILHVVYGTADKNAYYTSSSGGVWTAPIKLNTAGLGVTTTMGERGPKIVMGAAGRLVVVWSDLWTGSGSRTYARSSHSTDGGASWTLPVAITPEALFGVDGLSVAAGTYEVPMVVATFHVNTSAPTNASSATWMHYSLSLDGGESWSAPSLLYLEDGAPAIACSMCMTRPRFDADTGALVVGYRSATGNIRDFRVVRALDARKNMWQSTSIGAKWGIPYCPMNGPELTLNVPMGAPDATEVVAYMTGSSNNVYWVSRAARAVNFSRPVGTPLSEANERYPTAVASPRGDVVMVYNVGPMAVSGDAAVKYACYAEGNSTASQAGILGRSFAGTKATALALGSEGPLLIITTAT
jgi:hypothetical protein